MKLAVVNFNSFRITTDQRVWLGIVQNPLEGYAENWTEFICNFIGPEGKGQKVKRKKRKKYYVGEEISQYNLVNINFIVSLNYT